MKNALFIITLILLVFATGLFAQPKIQVLPGTTLDLGDKYVGQKAETIVTIKNVGNDTLKISEVKAGCGCTATMMSDKILAPLDSGKLSITFNTQGYGGQKVNKQVFVSSNDTSSPRVVINFSANVMNVLSLAPQVLNFDNSKADSTYTKSVTISNPSKQPIKILSVETKSELIKVSLMKNQLMPGEQTQLQAVFHTKKAGTYNGVIELVTDHPVIPKFEVKFFAWVNRK